MKLSVALLLSLFAQNVSAEVLSITSETYVSETMGKAVFIKFFAPWCGHCKAMAEDWEKLAADYAGNENAIIAEVDCTTEESEDLCQQVGVQGFPTLKYGDSTALDDYNGGRSYEELAAFAIENLKPICSPASIENCDDETKEKINKLLEMPPEDLIAEITKVEEKMAAAEAELETKIEGLQTQYEGFMADFEAAVKEIKDESGYGLLRSVLASKDSDDDDEDESASEL